MTLLTSPTLDQFVGHTPLVRLQRIDARMHDQQGRRGVRKGPVSRGRLVVDCDLPDAARHARCVKIDGDEAAPLVVQDQRCRKRMLRGF